MCFKRRRACKVPPKAMALPSERTLSAAELAALGDEELLRRAHADIVLPARERGVRLGMYGNHCVFPDEADEAEGAGEGVTFFHADEVRLASQALEAFFKHDLAGVRLLVGVQDHGGGRAGLWVFWKRRGIVACLLPGREFRRDDLHATLYLPSASAS